MVHMDHMNCAMKEKTFGISFLMIIQILVQFRTLHISNSLPIYAMYILT